nr:MAG TPA: hypothetical protein [Caudoviricetes sp.]
MNQEKTESSNLSISIFSRTGGEGSHARHPPGFGRPPRIRPRGIFSVGIRTRPRDSHLTRFLVCSFPRREGLLESRGPT